MPIRGPTDPSKIIEAIQQGATPYDGHVMLPRGEGEAWLAVIIDKEALCRRWILTVSKGVGIEEATFKMLGRARCYSDGRMSIDGMLYEFVPPAVTDESQLAFLAPA